MKIIFTIWCEVTKILIEQTKEKIRGDGLLTVYYLFSLLP